jgi:2-polyprenyl-3-methyl-5-hydroxy-6-metoxy-1,4-benzoquinol methylase
VSSGAGITPAASARERVACPLCGGRDERPLVEKDGFAVVRCAGCGLAYVNPRLTPAALTALYHAQAISPAEYYVRTARQDARSFDQRLALIERFRPPGALLDVGCGPGTFSVEARRRGWRTRGLDLNPASVAHCRALGLDVACEGFPSPAVAGDTFDAVVMNDFLEHVPDPLRVLRAARGLLAPGGVLFVSTPDIGSLVARLTGRRWLHLKPNEHLVYFDRRTIADLLARAGLHVEYVRAVGRVRNLGVALEKIRAYGELPSRLGRALVPAWLAERVNVPVNPGDEMAVVARA